MVHAKDLHSEAMLDLFNNEVAVREMVTDTTACDTDYWLAQQNARAPL